MYMGGTGAKSGRCHGNLHDEGDGRLEIGDRRFVYFPSSLFTLVAFPR